MRAWIGRQRGILLVVSAFGASVGAVAQDAYRLGPRDVVSIVVVGHEELSFREREALMVRPDGRISFPLVGEVQVSGKTPGEVEQLIEAALSKRYRHADVAVNIVQPRPQRIYVLGQVKLPGTFELEHEDIGLREAIAMAGGLTPQASTHECHLYGQGSEPETISLAAVLSDETSGDQARLLPGDTLFIQKKKTVTVVGPVQSPGIYEMEDGARVLDAIAAARGLTPLGDRNEAILLGASRSNNTVDLATAIATPESDANVPIRDGDTLVIREARNEVSVVGAVELPGAFYAGEGLTVAQALAQAGGTAEAADLAHVKLLRAGQDPEMMDLRPLVEHGPATSLEQFSAAGDDIQLGRGDVLVVPERPDRVVVLGAVQEPGKYPIGPGDRVTDALATAGGPIPKQSKTGRITLMRRDGEQVTTYTIDLQRIRSGRGQSQDRIVQHGDLIFVPGAKGSLRDSMWALYTGAGAARFLVDIFE